MDDSKSNQTFGCEHCWPATADAAWQAHSDLTRAEELIDESHFHVMILECPCCRQRFVSIFTERIDWESGDDPQYWSLLPVTEAEAADLVQQEALALLTEASLNSLGPGRRSLRHDHPKATAPRVFWATGIAVRMHD